MKLGFIGLGNMGSAMVNHLTEQGIAVVAYNRSPHKQATVQTITELVRALSSPRVIFLMVSAGAPVDEVLDGLFAFGIQKGDIVIDGGNSFYKDTVRRYDKLSKSGINYIDCGTSGGLEGARNGACLMLGGEKDVVESLSWLWNALALQEMKLADTFSAHPSNRLFSSSESNITGSLEPPLAENIPDSKLRRNVLEKDQLASSPSLPAAEYSWAYLGSSGAGHFVKMVHNGVEYGIDQALGEGFAVLEKSPYHLDLPKVADLWNHGSVVRSWLVELLARALQSDPTLSGFTGRVGGGETGTWALQTAKELGIEAEILEEAIEAREKSKEKPTFATKVVSALRRQYGGHEEPR